MLDKIKGIVSSCYAEMVKDSAVSLRLIQDEIDTLKSKMVLGGSGSGDKVRTSPSKDAIPNGVAKIQELTEDLETARVEYADNYRAFRKAVDQIDPIPKSALVYHYLLLRNWRQIADKMGYTYDGIMVVRKRGLIQLYDYIPIGYRDELLKEIQTTQTNTD